MNIFIIAAQSTAAFAPARLCSSIAVQFILENDRRAAGNSCGMLLDSVWLSWLSGSLGQPSAVLLLLEGDITFRRMCV